MKKNWKKVFVLTLVFSMLASGVVMPQTFAAENDSEDPLDRAKMLRNPISTEMIDVNMLENPDFEVQGPNGSITGWTEGLYLDETGHEVGVVSGSEAYAGKSLHIKDTNRSIPMMLMSKPIRVQPGQLIELAGQFRVKEGELKVGIHAYTETSTGLDDMIKHGIAATQVSAGDEWTPAHLNFTVPEGTHTIRVTLETRRGHTAEAFADALVLHTGKQMVLENFGAPIESVVASRAAYTVENGVNVMYVTMNGATGQLARINLDTFELMDQVELPDTLTRSLTIGSDGNVYTVGFYNGILTRYNPQTGETENINVILNPGHSVYDIVATPDGKIYGGTYARTQNDYARGFEYDIASNEWRDLGIVMDEMKYVHSIAYDDVHGGVYFGLAPFANIRKFDTNTGDWAGDVIDLTYGNKNFSELYKFVFDLDAYDGKVYARLSQRLVSSQPSLINLVIDAGDGDQILDTFPNNQAREVSPTRDNKVYFIYYATYNGVTDRWLAYYDLEKETPYRIFPVVRLAGSYLSINIRQLNHPDYPGDTLVAMKNDGMLFMYNFENQTSELKPLPVRAEAVTVHAIGSANDGTIYAAGYTSGGYAKFDPDTNMLTQITERLVGSGNTLYQSEMFIPYKEDQVFIPVYPGVNMNLYDPKKPWNVNNSSLPKNPVKLYDMNNSSSEDQERVYAGEVIERNGQETLVTVSVPARNNRTGRLAFYNLETKKLETYAPISDQSLVSLAYKDGFLYGGSSVWNSYGDAGELEPEAKMFVWDVEQNQLVKTFVPVAGKRAITKLIAGPDGNIWGFAEGHLFIYDPSLDEVIYDEAKFNIQYSGITYRDAFMEIADDGYMYGTIQGRFFMLDPESKSVYVINTGSKRYLTQSTEQRLFMMGPGHQLFKATDPARNSADLVNIKVNGQFIDGFDAAVTEYEVILPEDKTEVPQVEPTAVSEQASVIVNLPENLPGTAEVTVTSPDGSKSKTYRLNISVKVDD